jgi:hypothetical protein
MRSGGRRGFSARGVRYALAALLKAERQDSLPPGRKNQNRGNGQNINCGVGQIRVSKWAKPEYRTQGFVPKDFRKAAKVRD